MLHTFSSTRFSMPSSASRRHGRTLPPDEHLVVILHLHFLSSERYPCAHRIWTSVSDAAQTLMPCASKVQWSASVSFHACCNGDLLGDKQNEGNSVS